MASSRRVLLALAIAGRALAAQLTDATSKDNSPSCDCYFVSGPDSGFFQYYRFWDFRSLSAGDGSADAATNNFTVAPAVVSSSQGTGMDPVTSSFFNSTDWTKDWLITADVERQNSTYHIVNTPQNVYISRNTSAGAGNSTYLTMRTVRLPDWQSTSEIYTKQNNILHGSFRTRMRVLPNGLPNASAPSDGTLDDSKLGSRADKPVDDGAVVGFFTYMNDTEETDIEILTTEPTQYIHYTNQPDYIASTDTVVEGASTNATLPSGLAYTDWMEHRIDWFDGLTRWYVNGQLVLNKSQNAPTEPSGLFFNLWSDGGSWSGNMTVGGQVLMAIEWVEMAFNVSGDMTNSGSGGSSSSALAGRDSPSLCNTACNIDGVKQVGFPEKANSSVGTASGSNGGVSTTSAGNPAASTSKSAAAAVHSDPTGHAGTQMLVMLVISLFAGVIVLLW